jgi:hypothetical protein
VLKNNLRKICLVLMIAILSSLAWIPARAEEMTCPEHTQVEIDIKPGSNPNSINLSSKGLIPVAVITSPDFDASLFNPEMALLGPDDMDVENGCAGAMAVSST